MKSSMRYLTEAELRKIQNQEWSLNLDDDYFPYSDAGVFLQGSCQLFAYALNEKFGYNIMEIKQPPSCHYFCEIIRNGTKFWVDIRGITSDRTTFISGLKYLTDDVCTYEGHSKEELPSELKTAADRFGYCFAKRIIQQCPERYDVMSQG